MSAAVQVGASVQSVHAARQSILAIIKASQCKEVAVAALGAFQTVCKVDASFTGCTFQIGEKARKA